MRLSARLLPLAIPLLLLAVAAHGDGLLLSGVDGMSSTVMQQHQSSFSGLGLRARIRSDRLISGIEFMPTVEWWRSSNSVQPFGIETMRKDATLSMDARYEFHRDGVRPYVGAGFGIHFLSTRVNAPSLGLENATNSLIKGGLSALGGLSFGITGRLDNFLELKYHRIPEYSQLKFNWGLAYKL
jgi:opacity protein-like surface antigen